MKQMTFVIVVLALIFTNVGRADTVVVPNDLTAVEGPDANMLPFDDAGHYVLIYRDLAISAPTWITGIAFRPDGQCGGAFSTTLPDIQMALKSPNHDGIVETVEIHHRGALELSSSFTGPQGGPKDFDILIPFDTPVLYDYPSAPSSAFVQVEVWNYGGGDASFLDARYDYSLPERLIGWPNGDSECTIADGEELVTEFIVQPAPEPSTLVLLGIGASACSHGGGERGRRSVPCTPTIHSPVLVLVYLPQTTASTGPLVLLVVEACCVANDSKFASVHTDRRPDWNLSEECSRLAPARRATGRTDRHDAWATPLERRHIPR